MAGIDNLKGKGFDARTTDEARDIGRRGGIALGAARRRRRDMKARLTALLDAKPTADDLKNLKGFGIDPDDATMLDVVCAAIVKKAASGNVNAMQLLVNLTSDDPYVKAWQTEVKVRRDEAKLKRDELEHRKMMDEKRFERDTTNNDLAAAWLDAVIATQETDREAAMDGC